MGLGRSTRREHSTSGWTSAWLVASYVTSVERGFRSGYSYLHTSYLGKGNNAKCPHTSIEWLYSRPVTNFLRVPSP